MNGKLLSILVIIVALAMVLSMASFISPGVNHSSSSNTAKQTTTAANLAGSVSVQSPHNQKGAQVLGALHSKGIPNKYIYLPNFNPQRTYTGADTNGPSYLTAPAPMGIGTYGFSNTSGKIVRNNLSTSSFAASVTVNNFSTFYALDDGPNSVTMQLNAVLNNVTLFGNSNYAFWTQNVLFYSARTHSITFLDNVWNFSSPAFYLSPNVFSSACGTLVAPYYYYTVGPTFNVTYPFTVQLYLNSTVINGDNTVFFNYSLSDASGSHSGSYDRVQFNSSYGMGASYAAPQSNYLVDSYNVTPTGFIPWDAEVMIGGPGGGSTAIINQINATMTLKYLNSGSYANVPNAYDVGSETGETSTGAAVTWSANGVAHLSAGPSFIYGMWNVSQTSSFDHFSGQVNPPNSFMFVSQGSTFNAPAATWTPLSTTGSYSFGLPSGTYNASILMADRTPGGGLLASGTAQNFNLPMNTSMGVYTPLYAFGNSQLQYISQSGNGAPGNPYILYNNSPPSGYMNPLFGVFNDYIFPQFSGVLLHSTTAHVVMKGMPGFAVQYVFPSEELGLQYFGVTYTSNNLGYVLYNAPNVVIEHNYITGWFANTLTEFPVANMLLWATQNDRVSGNHFNVMDSGLLIYNQQYSSGLNHIENNYFIQDYSLNKDNYAGIAVSTTFGTSPYGPVAMSIYSSNNTISQNIVAVYDTAVSPFYSIYSGIDLHSFYQNNWNGNAWWNAKLGQHNIPYNNNGQIYLGGDFEPMKLIGFNSLVTNFKHV